MSPQGDVAAILQKAKTYSEFVRARDGVDLFEQRQRSAWEEFRSSDYCDPSNQPKFGSFGSVSDNEAMSQRRSDALAFWREMGKAVEEKRTELRIAREALREEITPALRKAYGAYATAVEAKRAAAQEAEELAKTFRDEAARVGVSSTALLSESAKAA